MIYWILAVALVGYTLVGMYVVDRYIRPRKLAQSPPTAPRTPESKSSTQSR